MEFKKCGHLYLLFFIMGIIGDLVLGHYIFNLWIYPYLNISKFINTKEIILFYFFMTICFTVITLLLSDNINIFGFGILSALVFCLIEVYNNKFKKVTLSLLILNNSIKLSGVLLITTILNVLLHEYPNVFANEWIYVESLFKLICLFLF